MSSSSSVLKPPPPTLFSISQHPSSTLLPPFSSSKQPSSKKYEAELEDILLEEKVLRRTLAVQDFKGSTEHFELRRISNVISAAVNILSLEGKVEEECISLVINVGLLADGDIVSEIRSQSDDDGKIRGRRIVRQRGSGADSFPLSQSRRRDIGRQSSRSSQAATVGLTTISRLTGNDDLADVGGAGAHNGRRFQAELERGRFDGDGDGEIVVIWPLDGRCCSGEDDTRFRRDFLVSWREVPFAKLDCPTALTALRSPQRRRKEI
ncbi:hypothetical protein TIFTF001_037030 [Ficus carica]|uniref:Uncharacterized protein n=1 Tax=Ficus carica TaxID=3494 RepID=A0AA88JBZ0_FICCA|nr:hypothetical protein TIFTF001_037026 [Ficus carica]GMN67972.1 hypothetical protein TIFTF001_037030 [Ficus carica]